MRQRSQGLGNVALQDFPVAQHDTYPPFQLAHRGVDHGMDALAQRHYCGVAYGFRAELRLAGRAAHVIGIHEADDLEKRFLTEAQYRAKYGAGTVHGAIR